MIKLLTALLLLVAMGGNAQKKKNPVNNSRPPNEREMQIIKEVEQWTEKIGTMRLPNYKVISTYDTSLLYKGNERCIHYMVAERERPIFDNVVMLAIAVPDYGPAGNPAYWLNKNYICKSCLYHINIKETRILKEVPDEYEEALQRLKNGSQFLPVKRYKAPLGIPVVNTITGDVEYILWVSGMPTLQPLAKIKKQ